MKQVSAALQQAMQEAAKRDESIHEGLSFEAFLIMLRADGQDSLDKVLDPISSINVLKIVGMLSIRLQQRLLSSVYPLL